MPAIFADRQVVKLDPAALTVDALLFDQLLRSETLQSLNQAVEMYQGDLLEGFTIRCAPFEDWLLVERQRLRHMYEGGLEPADRGVNQSRAS